MRIKSMLLAATAGTLLLPAAPALAQEAATATVDRSEIIVTARKRQESILNVPVVANVIGTETIENAQIVDLQGVATKVPGLFVSPGVNTIGTLISIRGIGTSALDVGVDQSISLNIDGQQFSQGLTFKSGLFDLEQAEVLKGPQALFFGKNSPGGVIALRTADPKDFAEVIGTASYEFEARETRLEAIVSGPVSDQFGLRLAASWSDREGFFKNTAGLTARPDLGGIAPRYDRSDANENYIIRATAVARPNDDFTARLKLNVTRDHSDSPNPVQYSSCLSGTGPSVVGIPFIGGANPCRLDRETEVVDLDPSPTAFPGIRNNGVPFITIRQVFGVLDLSYNVTPDISISSTTTYYENNTDGMIHGTYAGAAASIYADNVFYRSDFTQEIRLESNAPDAPLNWLLGGFYQDGKVKNDIVIGWNQELNPITSRFSPLLALPVILDRGTHNLDIDSKSLFGQLRWKPIETLEIAGGVRWTKEKRSNSPTRFGVPITIPNPSISSDNWSPELTITYTPTDDFTVFGALKQGYKSGSYQMITPNPPDNPATVGINEADRSFGDERIRGGEVGIKARALDRTLNVNAAFYYYRLNGLQIGVSQPAGVGGVPITLTKNAGKVETYGIDFDAYYRPPAFDGLSLNLSANWNKGKFVELDGLPCYGGQTIAAGCNQAFNPLTRLFTARSESGTPLERAPEWQVIGGFDYDTELSENFGFALGSSVQYSSSYTSPIGKRPDMRQAEFAKLNAYVTLKGKDDAWELSLIGNNLNNVIRCGYCTNSDFQNTTVLTALAQTTGGVTNTGPLNPAGHVDEIAGIAIPGRQVWVKLTVRPLGLFQ